MFCFSDGNATTLSMCGGYQTDNSGVEILIETKRQSCPSVLLVDAIATTTALTHSADSSKPVDPAKNTLRTREQAGQLVPANITCRGGRPTPTGHVGAVVRRVAPGLGPASKTAIKAALPLQMPTPSFRR